MDHLRIHEPLVIIKPHPDRLVVRTGIEFDLSISRTVCAKHRQDEGFEHLPAWNMQRLRNLLRRISRPVGMRPLRNAGIVQILSQFCRDHRNARRLEFSLNHIISLEESPGAALSATALSSTTGSSMEQTPLDSCGGWSTRSENHSVGPKAGNLF